MFRYRLWGLAVAARGYDVVVFEKLDKPGGRAYAVKQDGFVFDGGPTVITAPFLFDEIFELAGRRRVVSSRALSLRGV